MLNKPSIPNVTSNPNRLPTPMTTDVVAYPVPNVQYIPPNVVAYPTQNIRYPTTLPNQISTKPPSTIPTKPPSTIPTKSHEISYKSSNIPYDKIIIISLFMAPVIFLFYPLIKLEVTKWFYENKVVMLNKNSKDYNSNDIPASEVKPIAYKNVIGPYIISLLITSLVITLLLLINYFINKKNKGRLITFITFIWVASIGLLFPYLDYLFMNLITKNMVLLKKNLTDYNSKDIPLSEIKSINYIDVLKFFGISLITLGLSFVVLVFCFCMIGTR